MAPVETIKEKIHKMKIKKAGNDVGKTSKCQENNK